MYMIKDTLNNEATCGYRIHIHVYRYKDNCFKFHITRQSNDNDNLTTQ